MNHHVWHLQSVTVRSQLTTVNTLYRLCWCWARPGPSPPSIPSSCFGGFLLPPVFFSTETHDWIDVPDLTGQKHSSAGFFLLSCCVIKCFRWELVHLLTSKQIRCLSIPPAYSEKRFSNCESCRRVSSECVQGSKEMDLNGRSVGVMKGQFTGWTKNSSENNFTHLNPCNKAFPDI